MPDLVYCPFCGNITTVMLRIETGKDGYVDRYYVLCPDDGIGCGAQSGSYRTKEEAVLAWNHRYEPLTNMEVTHV